MKYLIVLICFWTGNCFAGWYAEIGVSTEFGERTLLSEPSKWCPNCQAPSILFHGAVGYKFKLFGTKDKVFVELDKKSLIQDEDDKGGYFGATVGLRFGD